MTSRMIMLQNLNCPTCAAKLEKAASALPGMKSARVSFAAGSLTVKFDPNVLSEDRIVALANQMGVDVINIVPGPASNQ